jgi:very-short-patch-repair endonuclease
MSTLLPDMIDCVEPKKKKQSQASKVEDSLFAEMKLFGLPLPVRQHIFHPTRRWRFDFAWIDRKIAVEIQGGIFMKGGGAHNRGAFMELDYDKINAAQVLGWKVFQFGPSQCRGKSRTMRASAALEFLDRVFRLDYHESIDLQASGGGENSAPAAAVRDR